MKEDNGVLFALNDLNCTAYRLKVVCEISSINTATYNQKCNQTFLCDPSKLLSCQQGVCKCLESQG